MVRTIIISITFSTFPHFKIAAQVRVKEQHQKITPAFRLKLEQWNTDTSCLFTIQAKSLTDWKTCIATLNDISVIYSFEPSTTFIIKTRPSVLKHLLNCNGIVFADDVKQPKEELLLGFTDYAANGISLLQSQYPQYNGNGLAVSIKENRFDTTDIDFKGRVLTSNVASPITSGHASAMATIIAGAGNSWNYTKGAAWNSKLSSASFSNLLPEAPSYYQQPFIHVQNHSYGTVIESFYGAEAASYDASVIVQPQLLHVFSIGNSGTVTPVSGRYAGISNYANSTGNFKHAKNILTVGHIDSFYNVLAPSSRGPAFDGRIKPELVAFGEDGSSGAAALVSGIALTLQQAYQQLYGQLPSAALIKSILVNSADDVGAAGIDFASGYGNANGFKAMQTVIKGRFFNGSIASNTTQTLLINIPAGIHELKLTLSWTDPAAVPNTGKALINDLDLELQHNGSLQIWKPWVLNSFPHIDSLTQLPQRQRDTLNNTEQITIRNPQAGAYTIFVKSNTLSTASQQFSIAWQLDSAETFQWYYPSKNDHLLPPDSNVIRWQTTYNGTGELHISTDDGNSWQLIDDNVNLGNGWLKYAPPSVYTKALMRMKTGNVFHLTDTFTISQRVNTSVGFNCVDSVMINWDRLPGITQYRVLRLGNEYMEPFTMTTDTFLILGKSVNNSLHYAVEPFYQSRPLVRSYTFNYELQGSGCYIRTFLTDLTTVNTGFLQLFLSSAARVSSIVFEKRNAGGFVPIQTIAASSNNLLYTHTDPKLNTGPNIYRAAVVLNDGRKFYSEESTLLYNGVEKAIIYPNPVSRGQSLFVLAKPEDELMIQLINSNGSIISEIKLNDIPEQISISHLSRGVYYYRVLNKEKQKIKSGSIVVY